MENFVDLCISYLLMIAEHTEYQQLFWIPTSVGMMNPEQFGIFEHTVTLGTRGWHG